MFNSTRISGATTGTLTINAVTAADAGSYDVQVRGGCNPAAVATSYPAVLTVVPCYANCDGSTIPPILTPNDFQCFLNAFAAGCP